MKPRYVFYIVALLAMLALALPASAAGSVVVGGGKLDAVPGWNSPAPMVVDGDGSISWSASLAVVAGHPAMSYYDAAGDGQVKYVRALDATGSTWGAPVVIAQHAAFARSDLVVINGHPAVAYFTTGTPAGLWYARALDSTGETWAAPSLVAGPAYLAAPSLTEVKGHPAIAFGSDQAIVVYSRALDEEGTSWGAGVIVDNVRTWATSLVIVNGAPAIAYLDGTNYDLKYVRSGDADGVSWTSPVTLESDGMTGYWPSMVVVAGSPAIAYSDISASTLKFIRGLDSIGASWGAPVVVDDVYSMWASLAVVNELPAISYFELGSFRIQFVRSWDGQGRSWRQPLPIAVPGEWEQGISTSLAVIEGHPGIGYYQTDDADLMYVRADNPSGTRMASTPGLYQGQVGAPIDLDGSASTGAITEYAWDCTSDGSYDGLSPNPTGSTCTYPAEGRYALRLRVTDTGGLTDEDTADVIVAPGSAAGTDCGMQTDIPPAECEALVALYNSTDGPHWSDSPGNGWNLTQTPCSWTGVTCSAGDQRHVARIVREDKNLTGIIPVLSALAYLEGLDLGSNHLNGTIPSAFPTNLKYLSLRANQLSGSIPDLSGLGNLQALFLNNNQLDGTIPGTFPISLEYLYLSLNQLSGSIPDLSALINLKYLLLGENELSGAIPSTLPLGLEYLYLGGNQLSGSIPDLSGMTNLQWLGLYTNQLSGSIPDLSALTNLRFLGLGDNRLSGSIPDLSALVNLEDLALGSNQLSGAIPDLSALTRLRNIHLWENQLSGRIPNLSSLARLRDLSVQGNQLSGPIPGLSALINLEVVDMANNQLSGTIPDLSSLSLRFLHLANNQLSGMIPAWVCTVDSYLNLDYNKFTDAADPCVTARIPEWADTQTVPPAGVQARRLTPTSAELTWQPILYTGDGGRYEAWCGTQSGGPYTLFGETADKFSAGLTLTGLAPSTPYYCVLRTYTPAHGEQQNDLTSIDSAEVIAPAGNIPQNLLSPEGWRFWADTAGVNGAMTDGVMGIDVSSGPARACWYQDISASALRNQTVRFEVEMRKTAAMSQINPPFTNPYVSLQVQKSDGSRLNNYGGTLYSHSAAGGPWVSETRDTLLPQDMITLRAAFCVWNATPGLAQARFPLLRAVMTPPHADNLLTPNWVWAPATPGLSGSRPDGTLRINVASAGARGCWIQDLAGAPLQGKTVYYEAAMSKSAEMNAPYGFANPYISLQVRRANGIWDYNYPRNTTLNASASPGGGFVTEARKYLLPADMVTLRAAFCVWDAAPGLAQGKDFLLRLVAPAQNTEPASEGGDLFAPSTPSILPEDAVVQPQPTLTLWLPLLRK